MGTAIKLMDPAENEFLAQLEKKSGKPNHFYRTMANRPDVLKNFVALYGSIRGPGLVERRIKELVYLASSLANECAYCSAAHIASSKKAGVSEDEIAALRAEQDSPFSPAERAAIQYPRELTRTADARHTPHPLLQYFTSPPISNLPL